jgi:hypothetical protein
MWFGSPKSKALKKNIYLSIWLLFMGTIGATKSIKGICQDFFKPVWNWQLSGPLNHLSRISLSNKVG